MFVWGFVCGSESSEDSEDSESSEEGMQGVRGGVSVCVGKGLVL